MKELKIGDTVKLKSGGPLMTVSERSYDFGTFEGKWLCKWFEGTKSQSDIFHQDSLSLHDQE